MERKLETIKLTGMAYGGEALGRSSEGRMVFVPFGLPGETVRVEVVDSRKRWARARLIEVDERSPDRQEPRCPHFEVCGGCHYQHIPYETQLAFKQEILVDQLSRLGKFSDPPVHQIVASPSPWGTRSKASFTLTKDGKLAYHGQSPEILVPVEECPILRPELDSLRQSLQLDSLPGVDRVILRTSDSGDMLIFEGNLDEDFSFHFDLPISVVWIDEKGVSILSGSDQLLYSINGLDFVVSAGSFFQVNTALVPDLVQHVLSLLHPQPGQRILDAYAGVGLFSKFLAEEGASVTAVEASPWACRDFELNLDPYEDIAIYEAGVEEALPALGHTPDSILLDPPRSGLGKEARQQLLSLQVPTIVYVSCDPATLARDARFFREAGYEPASFTPFDLFPQTYHIETVSHWILR